MSSRLKLEGDAGPSAPRLSLVSAAVSSALQASAVPAISNSNVNISQSTGVHIGPKFEIVTVTQIVEGQEQNGASRSPPNTDAVKKKKSPWIRACWGGIVLAWLLTIALIIHLVIIFRTTELLLPEEVPWRMTREEWNASYVPSSNRTLDEFSPIRLVIIQHTVSAPCFDTDSCSAAIRSLQDYFLTSDFLGYDLPYNFMIGNDGRVYDARLWQTQGAHTAPYNRCSIGIGFIGDYREDVISRSRVTELQMTRLRRLLQEGVDQGYLRHDYSIVGASDLTQTFSPGDNLLRAIRSLVHYDWSDYRGMTCEDMIAHHKLKNG